jgi:hypothetical protein
LIEIRPARDSDEEGIRVLFKTCFGNELSHEAWVWKYGKSYLGSSSFVAEDDGRIVAHYGGFRLRFYSRGMVLNAYQGCDVMTHPRYRARLFSRKGIIVKTAEAFYDTNPMEFIYGFPSERHGRLKALQLGFEKHRYVTVMKKEREYYKACRKIFLNVETGWNGIRPDEIDDAWRKTKDAFPLSIEKTNGYIFWRYRDKPSGNYELMTVRGFLKKNLKAYVIIKPENEVLHVLDWFILPSLDFKRLLSVLEDFARKRGAQCVTFWCNPVEEFFAELKTNGYSEERGIPYIVKVFEESRIRPDFFLDYYCYRQGDYDAA